MSNSNIRKLETNDIEVLTKRIWTNAFHAEGVSEEHIEGRKSFANVIINKLDEFNLYGFFDENQLLGAMVLTDYTMNLHSTKTLMGGLRAVSVDLMHKKERIALNLVKFACSYYKERGSCILGLYPFRTDFYKKMGFGYGTTLKEYKVKPENIPSFKSREHLRYWENDDDRQSILDCYHRFVDQNHGMFNKLGPDIRMLFLPEKRIVAYWKDGKVEGYINFSFRTENEYKNYLVIHEFIYETKEVFGELCTFLNTQADQFEYIIFQTQDEYLHYNFNNPADGTRSPFDTEHINFCVSSVGMMYRIINVKKYFEVIHHYNFNHQTCKLKITINDNLFISNQGSIIIDFEDGIATIAGDNKYDVEIKLDVAEFSSLVMGSIQFKTLYRYGLASISDNNFIEIVDKIFTFSAKPICNTFF